MNRIELINDVELGKKLPKEAKQLAHTLGLGDLECFPDDEKYDAKSLNFFDLQQTLIWISTRNYSTATIYGENRRLQTLTFNETGDLSNPYKYGPPRQFTRSDISVLIADIDDCFQKLKDFAKLQKISTKATINNIENIELSGELWGRLRLSPASNKPLSVEDTIKATIHTNALDLKIENLLINKAELTAYFPEVKSAKYVGLETADEIEQALRNLITKKGEKLGSAEAYNELRKLDPNVKRQLTREVLIKVQGITPKGRPKKAPE